MKTYSIALKSSEYSDWEIFLKLVIIMQIVKCGGIYKTLWGTEKKKVHVVGELGRLPTGDNKDK